MRKGPFCNIVQKKYSIKSLNIAKQYVNKSENLQKLNKASQKHIKITATMFFRDLKNIHLRLK